MRLSPAALAILIVVTVAACQGSSSATEPPGASLGPAGSQGATASASVTPSATASATVTAMPSTGPLSTTQSAASGALGSPFHAAGELERAVPNQAGGLPLTIESVTGPGFSDAAGNHIVGLRCRWYQGRGLRCRDQAQLAAVLTALGRSPADVSIAVGHNETKNKEIEVQATRVTGVTGAQVREAVLTVLRDAAVRRKGTLNAATATIGGKSVTVITYTSPYPLGLRRFLYAAGDVFYDVRRAYDAPAAEILQGLP